MNEEIETMANICEMNKNEWSSHKQGFCYAQAEALYNAGYRKTVWHKVVDGDLPKGKCLVLIFYESEILGKHYTTDLFYMGRFVNHEGQVIAWTELPKYEGEEK